MNQELLQAFAQLVGHPQNGGLTNHEVSPPGGDFAERAVVSSDYSGLLMHQLEVQGYTRTHRFLVLPSPSKPRLLLPLGDSRRTRQGLHIYAPYAFAARMLKNVAVSIVRAGWKGQKSSRVQVASKEPLPIEVLVGEVTGEWQPVFALSLGSPSQFRKLTVQVMRPDGEILGYIKLPFTDAAGERLRHEAYVLERLWDNPTLRHHIPKVFHAGQWQGSYILFESRGPVAPGDVEFGPSHLRFLQALWAASPSAIPGQDIVDRVAARWKKVSSRHENKWHEMGEALLQKAGRGLGGASIPCGIMHGDFAPWNTRGANGHLFVLDWEAADWQSPNLWDVFHFHTQVASLLNRTTKEFSMLQQTPGEKEIFWLYLLRSMCQELEEDPADRPGLNYRRQVLLREFSQA